MPKSLSADIENDVKSAIHAEKVFVDVANCFWVTYATVNDYANKFFPHRQPGLGGRPMVVVLIARFTTAQKISAFCFL
ncbi:hypothetical protein G6F57_015584 [Rhizopus arrhizus]|nr:hypothetical protein G6F23_014114 [Rhizopus arrhizus]KAG0803907.1 hypothetical protein G6F20_013118 [Rhizopus arrhizus]KAG0808979.1 hypothetical protein G6F18_013758 [Rhizopus arrhizus]KAG0813155.1 hypothetical protein G6F19_013255 [Rhizopus arrhizus]KAG0845906.1 hypothetical protein G6F17_013458 [Rhizopus arrhizus]